MFIAIVLGMFRTEQVNQPVVSLGCGKQAADDGFKFPIGR